MTAYSGRGKSKQAAAERYFRIEKPVIQSKKVQLAPDATLSANELIGGLQYVSVTRWESKKPGVASIDAESGIVKALSAGSTKITAYFGSGKEAAKLNFTLKVK